MNASPNVAPEEDQIFAEYERLKPLRDLESSLRKERPGSHLFGLGNCVISTGVAVWAANLTLLHKPTPSFGTWDFVVVTALITWLGLIWTEYARSKSRVRWLQTATLLRTLAQDINELRAEKKL